ncbi:hypothetical protein [Pandoraea apista]|uniref:hypothetical protein n=1 Tax=Pandoraea apista TaxID=93218 RepID=UPI00058AA51A|nr:hypothetical protein [Pandoraea apista]AJE97264.1 hypothetical protein SG18_02120 [Pandoraea apista]AKH71229.1 hypothetical protein XM39_02120 [Pandoraea apista]AKI63501.1 hypothetical protein AA956_19440 [Pandoraea apista]
MAFALSGCQLVEQELKLYITDAFELAKKCIGSRMTFKFSGEDYENSSLEGLIGTFRKLSGNGQLAKDLDAFKKERNFLSHQAISYCIDYDGELTQGEVEKIRPRLDAIRLQSEVLRMSLHDEANSFRGHLYFEDFDGNS